MKIVIPEASANKHIINKYNFKVLPSHITEHTEGQESNDTFISGATARTSVEENTVPDIVEAAVSGEQGEALSKSSKDELIESLLQKTDEMSSNFIKLQMKLEAKEEEYKQALQTAKNEAFEEGKRAGIEEAQSQFQSEHTALMQQFSSSVETLDKSAKEFSTSIEGIKEELIHAAVDVAKEVILVETSERGNEIASILAKELIADIQNASKVTIKVNPNDKLTIEQTLGNLENVSILSDNAVSNGGVIVLSDAGNIDGDIMKRYERVKNAALGK